MWRLSSGDFVAGLGPVFQVAMIGPLAFMQESVFPEGNNETLNARLTFGEVYGSLFNPCGLLQAVDPAFAPGCNACGICSQNHRRTCVRAFSDVAASIDRKFACGQALSDGLRPQR